MSASLNPGGGPVPNPYNYVPGAGGTLSRAKAGIDRIRAGQAGAANMAINFVGHSAVTGVGAGTVNAFGQYTNGAEPYAPPAALAKTLGALGIPTRKGSWFGTQGFYYLGQNVAAWTAYDTRIGPLSSAWTYVATNESGISLGGNIIQNNTTTDPFVFTPVEPFDTVDVYDITINGSTAFTVDIGGAVLATTSAGTATSIRKTTVSGLSAGTHTINLKKVAANSAAMFPIGIETRLSALPQVMVRNIGWQTATSAMIADTTNAFNSGSVLANALMAAELNIICCRRNDQNGSVSHATWKANIQSLINGMRAAGNCDIILISDHCPTPSSFYYQDALYINDLYALASANGCALMDIPARQGSAVQLSALGLFCPDNVHETAVGWQGVGGWLGAVLAGLG